MLFINTCGDCGEETILEDHDTTKLYVTVMGKHDCPKTKLTYVIEVSMGFKLVKPPNPKREPRDSSDDQNPSGSEEDTRDFE